MRKISNLGFPKGNFYQNLNHQGYLQKRFFTPEFSQEISKFQNSEYEVHQSSRTDEICNT
jgi:hypothetical protein